MEISLSSCPNGPWTALDGSESSNMYEHPIGIIILCDFRGRSILVGLKKNPYLPTLILKTMQSETHIFFFWA
jgi:hypothetical protein